MIYKKFNYTSMQFKAKELFVKYNESYIIENYINVEIN